MTVKLMVGDDLTKKLLHAQVPFTCFETDGLHWKSSGDFLSHIEFHGTLYCTLVSLDHYIKFF